MTPMALAALAMTTLEVVEALVASEVTTALARQVALEVASVCFPSRIYKVSPSSDSVLKEPMIPMAAVAELVVPLAAVTNSAWAPAALEDQTIPVIRAVGT